MSGWGRWLAEHKLALAACGLGGLGLLVSIYQLSRPWDWGTVPEWIGGIGTAAAFLVVAVGFRHEMAKSDLAQQDRADTAAREADAREREATARERQAAIERRRDASGVWFDVKHREEALDHWIVVCAAANNGTAPAYEPHVAKLIEDRVDSMRTTVGGRPVPTLMPGDDLEIYAEETSEQAEVGSSANLYVLVFRDPTGRVFTRSATGTLYELDERN